MEWVGWEREMTTGDDYRRGALRPLGRVDIMPRLVRTPPDTDLNPVVTAGEDPDRALIERIRSANRHQMAEAVGCDLSHASRVCSGQRKPALEMAMAMARYFGCTVEELVEALAAIQGEG